ncbi:MAG: glycosyltransferase family 4 protein, partial [Oscillospiraceae bacterium]
LYGLYKNEVKIAKRLKPDVVIASSTYPFDAYFAIKIAKISGAAFVYEIHDIWPLSLEVLHGYSEKHPLIRAIHTAQKKAVKSADLVVSILAYADRYLKENGLFPKRYLHIPNGIDFEEVNITSNYLPLIQKYKQDGFFVLVYAGGFAQANALNELILSAKNVDDDVVYILIGDGSEKVKIKRLIDKNNIKNILLLDSIPKNEIKSVLTQADCLYIGAKKSILYEYGIGMNKLYDYMNSGKPVICGIQAADNPIEKAGCGVIIPAENSVVIAQAVQTLKAMTDEQLTEMGTKGNQYTKAYHDCNILAKNFATALEQLFDIRSIHW